MRQKNVGHGEEQDALRDAREKGLRDKGVQEGNTIKNMMGKQKFK